MNDCITTTKQSTTKPCAYFLGYTVDVDVDVDVVVVDVVVAAATTVAAAAVVVDNFIFHDTLYRTFRNTL